MKKSLLTAGLMLAASVAFGYDDVAWRFDYSGRPADIQSTGKNETELLVLACSAWQGWSPQDSALLSRSVFENSSDWVSVCSMPLGFLLFLK